MRDRQVGVSPSGGRDPLPAHDVVVLVDEHAGEPRARARDAAAVIDRKEEPAAHLAGEGHDPIVGRDDNRADLGGDVYPAVAGPVGIVGWIEPADDGAGDGPLPRDAASVRTDGHHRTATTRTTADNRRTRRR